MRRSAFLAPFLTCTFICGCWESCDYAVLFETKSPDGKLKAVVFQRGCGTPIDSSAQISILNGSASSPVGRGNVFIAGDENQAVPVDAKQANKIKVSWESNTSLSVSYPKNVQVFLKKPEVAGVAIRYETAP